VNRHWMQANQGAVPTMRDPQLQRKDGWVVYVVASLLMTACLWLGYTLQGYAAEPQQDITVQQGQLSVNLRAAEVWDVLTVIGQQAGITILGDPRPKARVSTQFTGMPLDEGLRRLLRLASLSSTMLYAHAPAGAMVLTSVYVFEEATGPAPHPQVAAAPPTEDRQEEVGRSFAEALAQLSTALPLAPQVGEHDGAERFRALLESAQHQTVPPRTGEENELARRFREALEQSLHPSDETSPSDLPQIIEYRE
jgi:hypothetical protein